MTRFQFIIFNIISCKLFLIVPQSYIDKSEFAGNYHQNDCIQSQFHKTPLFIKVIVGCAFIKTSCVISVKSILII